MTSSFTIRYSPSNSLHFQCIAPDLLPHPFSGIYNAFASDWRAGWFLLASQKPSYHEPTIYFWQDIASHFLTALCHLQAGTSCEELPTPDQNLLSDWILRAPPMEGGEYLSIERIASLWDELNKWFLSVSAKANYKEVHQFLKDYAPLWQKVGQVCFHLAENKNNVDRPFAFLATYTTGFGSGGKLKHLPLKEALNQYSGSNNRQALIKLLTPIHQASEKCPWIQKLLTTTELYQPLAWSPQEAYKFLSTIPQLEESGLSVKIPNWWKQRSRPQVSVTIDTSQQSTLGMAALLDFNIQIAIGNDQLSEEELLKILSKDQNLAFVRGQWIEVDKEKLQEALTHWKQVQKKYGEGQISFIEGMRLLAGAPSDLDSADENEDQNRWVRVTPGDALAGILHQLRNPSLLSSKGLQGLNAELRPYQHEGLGWLSLLSGLGLGACLADDMGLGKTIQILSLLLLQQQSLTPCKQPSLLIVPASLLSNWQREATRFTPSLKLFLLHPSEMKGVTSPEIGENSAPHIKGMDLVITTYSMVTRIKWLTDISWNILILDEAQAIKNSGTKQTKAVKSLVSKSKIALTGTPIENRLSDLWSLFDFLNPGLLGSPKDFKNYVSYLQTHPSRFESLRKLTSPYILRRMKTDPKVISDLPNKIETAAYCYLTVQQVKCYQAVVDELQHTISSIEPIRRRACLVLRALMQLKQNLQSPFPVLQDPGIQSCT